METNEGLTKTLSGCFNGDATLPESLSPIFGRSWRHRVTGSDHLSGADASAANIGPRKKREDRSRVPNPVAKVKMIRARIVEVNGPLHQAKAQDARVKVEVSLRVARDSGDMMDPVQLHR